MKKWEWKIEGITFHLGEWKVVYSKTKRYFLVFCRGKPIFTTTSPDKLERFFEEYSLPPVETMPCIQ
jgi:hypothetical protein